MQAVTLVPRPAQAQDGSLTEHCLPAILSELSLEERTCTLVLSGNGIEKRICIEGGSPISCESNLLSDALGPYLVSRNRLREDQYQLLHAECRHTGARFEALLLEKVLLGPLELYKELRTHLALKILECFHWRQGTYQLVPQMERPESAIRMNMMQLILKGVKEYLPLEVLDRELPPGSPFTFERTAQAEAQELRLGKNDRALLAGLDQALTVRDLAQRVGLDGTEVRRALLALRFTRLVRMEMQEGPASEPSSLTTTVEAPPSTMLSNSGQPPEMTPTSSTDGTAHSVQDAVASDAPPSTTDVSAAPPHASSEQGSGISATWDLTRPVPEEEVASLWLEAEVTTALFDYRHKDAFDLLGVDPEISGPQLRRTFLELLDRYSPARFNSADAKERAGELVIAYAKAFFALSDPDDRARLQRKRHRKNSETETERAKPTVKAEDPRQLFAEGRELLEAGNLWGAIEKLKSANDIEPRPLFRGYLAYVRYVLNPALHADAAIRELTAAAKSSPDDHRVVYFLGELFRARADWESAHECYRLAVAGAPEETRYQTHLKEAMRHLKTNKGFFSRFFDS